METIGNITDEAIQRYIKEQSEESRKEDSKSTVFAGHTSNTFVTPLLFWGGAAIVPNEGLR